MVPKSHQIFSCARIKASFQGSAMSKLQLSSIDFISSPFALVSFFFLELKTYILQLYWFM